MVQNNAINLIPSNQNFSEKDEYSRLYEFLKSKKIVVKSTGKMDASKLDLSSDNIDHYAETVKADAESSDGSNNSMSSDDEGILVW